MSTLQKMLSGLNPHQFESTVTINGPLLIIAGPGSGKTRVVTSRILFMLEDCSIAPEEILAITFTRKAAEEMAARVGEFLGRVPSGLTICTFHSLGYRILREHYQLAGLDKRFKIVTEKEQYEIARKFLERESNSGKQVLSSTELIVHISRAKNEGYSIEQLKRKAANSIEVFAAEYYQWYEAELKARGALDLNDLIIRAVRDVLMADKSVQAAYKRRYRYIMVDEYQDTNFPQSQMLKCLVGKEQNVCVVGDDDQAIYGFRGSDPKHILHFSDDYRGAKLVKLEQNYRSFEPIVQTANGVIGQNENRYQKTIVSMRGDGPKVKWKKAGCDEEEIDWIAKCIRNLTNPAQGNYGVSDIALLFRMGSTAADFRKALIRRGVKCKKSNKRFEEGVELVTLHSSKGLEWPCVFLPTLEDTMVPHYRATLESGSAIEEERRLFFVGISRAKERLMMSCSLYRDERESEPTRFLQ